MNSEIKIMQNKQNLEHIAKKVEFIKKELLEEMRSYGILPETAEKIFSGKKIINCFKCHTPNMYPIDFHFGNDLKYYKCENCGETYVE